MPIHERTLEQIRRNDPSLRVLDLTGTCPPLTANDMEVLVQAIEEGKNTHLISLVFGGNPIGKEGAKHLSRLKSIEILVLGGANLMDEGAESIAQMTSLQRLHLSYNSIGSRGFLALINQLPHLYKLNMMDNQVPDSAARQILGNTQLTEVFLDGNPDITPETLLAIKQRTEENKRNKSPSNTLTAPNAPGTLFSSSAPNNSNDASNPKPTEVAKEVEALIAQLIEKLGQLSPSVQRSMIDKVVTSVSSLNASPRNSTQA